VNKAVVNKDVSTTTSPATAAGSRTVRRWLPAAIVPAAIIAVAVTVPAVADSTPNLPEKSAQEVLELVAQSVDAGYSGTVEQDSDLGLPELPTMGSGSGSDSPVSSALELLTGSHTARVYIGSEHTARFQLMDTLAQRDVVVNGSDVWYYSSSANEAVHVTLPDDLPQNLKGHPQAPDATALPEGVPTTPAELARKLLATIDPTTEIVVGDTARIAGRSVYTLTLTPDSADTLVDSVELSVDAETGLPLGVSVAAAGQTDPAFSIQFSDISFGAPDAALFAFTPPAGAAVTEKDLTDAAAGYDSPDGTPPDTTTPDGTTPDAGHPGFPDVIGEGWSSIVVIPAESLALLPNVPQNPELQQLLGQLTTVVPEGRLFESALVSALLSTDGRLFVGAVSGEQLQAAAQSTP
jgi:outer membrane lipoprotein-sorting protein